MEAILYKKIGFLFTFFISVHAFGGEIVPIAYDWKLPLDTKARKDFSAVYWEQDAGFMAKRLGGHLHTGVDLMNSMGGPGEKVYAASTGQVVSIYAKEPNLSVMIQHMLPSRKTVWTVYVHVTTVKVKLGDLVTSDTVIAYLMYENQLDKYGWQFNHLHFEVLKTPRINEVGKYLSFSTGCKTKKEVRTHFYNPITFFENMWWDGKKPPHGKDGSHTLYPAY